MTKGEIRLVFDFMDINAYTEIAGHELYEIDPKVFPTFAYWKSFRSSELKFDDSWDLLIPVRTKIISDELRNECLEYGVDNWMETDLMDAVLENTTDINKLYKAVIDFLKWYKRVGLLNKLVK